jgi:prevent-host-death family protein
MTKANIHEAKTNLSKLIAKVQTGEEVILCKGNQPVARLVGLRTDTEKRPPAGVITSKSVHYTPDCFAPSSDDELRDWGI